MKTIKEWLEELPEHQSRLALKNTCKAKLKLPRKSLLEALVSAFNFTESEQGYDYWDQVVDGVIENEYEQVVTHKFPQGGGVVVSGKHPQKALELLMLGVDAGTLINMLKDKAEELGYNLVQKPYEPKVGDFGMFWDFNEDVYVLDYISKIIEDTGCVYYQRSGKLAYNHFRKLTEEEKKKIQENW
jgi:hypothetical protein